MEGTDICFAPVLNMDEAPKHPHNIARKSFVEIDGVVQTAPAPRFSRTPGEVGVAAVAAGQNSTEVLSDIGLADQDIADLLASGAIAQG